jgi:lysyl endopeptidase
MKTILLFALILCVITTSSFSQVRTRTYFTAAENKEVAAKRKPAKEHTITIPSEFEQEKNKYITGKNEVTGNYLYKVALPVQVNIDIIKEAEIVRSKDTIHYLIKGKAPKVYNVSFHFSDFFLSQNTTMFIYTNKQITGPITEKQNNSNNFWATIPYNGDEINIELNVPIAQAGISRLIISKVFLGYADVSGEYFGSPGNSAACNRNVACPEGVGWDNEKRTVALINMGGTSRGTGALIMNACGTNIPYFLTAQHNVADAPNVNQWVFQFQYWSTDCETNTGFNDNIQYTELS